MAEQTGLAYCLQCGGLLDAKKDPCVHCRYVAGQDAGGLEPPDSLMPSDKDAEEFPVTDLSGKRWNSLYVGATARLLEAAEERAGQAWAAGCWLAGELMATTELWLLLAKDFGDLHLDCKRAEKERDEVREQRDMETQKNDQVSCYHGRCGGGCPREDGVKRARKILLMIYDAMTANAAPYDLVYALRKAGKCELKAELLLPIAEWGEALKGGIS